MKVFGLLETTKEQFPFNWFVGAEIKVPVTAGGIDYSVGDYIAVYQDKVSNAYKFLFLTKDRVLKSFTEIKEAKVRIEIDYPQNGYEKAAE